MLLVSFVGSTGQEATRNVFKVSGIVQYPDGTPSAGATVTGVTACEGEQYHLFQEAKTAVDGSFDLQFVDSACDRIRLGASKIDGFWLKTGMDIFYAEENGIAPIIEGAATAPPAKAVIRLGARGGLVDFRVWDKATGRFIWALVHLERQPVPGARFGSMDFATGRDGSADTLFLPAGDYQYSVEQYACNSTDYVAASTVDGTLKVEAGHRTAKEVSLDVRKIKPVRLFSNPRGKPCKPSLDRHPLLH